VHTYGLEADAETSNPASVTLYGRIPRAQNNRDRRETLFARHTKNSSKRRATLRLERHNERATARLIVRYTHPGTNRLQRNVILLRGPGYLGNQVAGAPVLHPSETCHSHLAKHTSKRGGFASMGLTSNPQKYNRHHDGRSFPPTLLD
jgi:hypothetical protein